MSAAKILGRLAVLRFRASYHYITALVRPEFHRVETKSSSAEIDGNVVGARRESRAPACDSFLDFGSITVESTTAVPLAVGADPSIMGTLFQKR